MQLLSVIAHIWIWRGQFIAFKFNPLDQGLVAFMVDGHTFDHFIKDYFDFSLVPSIILTEINKLSWFEFSIVHVVVGVEQFFWVSFVVRTRGHAGFRWLRHSGFIQTLLSKIISSSHGSNSCLLSLRLLQMWDQPILSGSDIIFHPVKL